MKKLVTFNFTVINNMKKYAGVKFPEIHLLNKVDSSIDWAKKNLTNYFNQDFRLESIEES